MVLQDAPDLLTVQELAEVLRISRRHAYAAVKSGEVPSIRIGQPIRIPRDRLQRYLQQPAQPEPAA